MDTDIRIIIADDHPIFRHGLRQIIELEAGFRVLGEAGEGRDALRLIQELQPDVAVLDVNMPDMKGFQVARQVQQEGLNSRIIFLTMYDDESIFNEAMNVGAKGYLLKDSASSDIVDSIRAVAAGEHYLSPAISKYLINRAARRDELNQQTGLKDLTATELRILKLIAQNRSSQMIAGELFISLRTVQNHRYSICQKLSLHGNNALIRFALEHRSELS